MKSPQSEKSVTQIPILGVDSTLISNNFIPNQRGKFRRNANPPEDRRKWCRKECVVLGNKDPKVPHIFKIKQNMMNVKHSIWIQKQNTNET